MTTQPPRPHLPAPVEFLQVRTPALVQRAAPRGLWMPATALAASMALAAAAGVTLGILAATQTSIARDRWIAVVQAHAAIQLWGWFAVSIVVLVFEFIVRLNRHPALPLAPRAAVLLLFTAGALVSAAGGVLGRVEQPLAVTGAILLAAGSVQFAVLVFRVPPGRPLPIDLHPLFFRTGAAWLAVCALLGLLATSRMSAGVVPPHDFDATTEVFLRGFVLNVVVAVGLRAFPGHLGLPQVPVQRQRVLYAVLNASVVAGLARAGGLGLPDVDALARLADLGMAATIAWATHAFQVTHAVRAWGHHSERYQVMVPVAWLGLVVYGVVLAVQAAALALDGGSTVVMAAGAARHVFVLGFVAPLLVAMLHVVLERFGTGHLVARDWLTAAFVLIVVSWPLRAGPPLLDPTTGTASRAVMGLAGILVVVALLLASAAAARNALAAARFARQFGRGG